MSEASGLEVIVLAAGRGKRMRSKSPKMVHTLAGRPLLQHVLDAVSALAPERVHVVVGHQAEQVQDVVGAEADVNWVQQGEPQGTGHAVGAALPSLARDATALILLGDVPLVSVPTLQACVAAAGPNSVALVTAELDDPAQLGRIVRNEDGSVAAIVEYADATDAQREQKEINSGIMALPAALLGELLVGVSADNAQGEYYLTDIVTLARARHIDVVAVSAPTQQEVAGVNDRAELAELERHYQQRIAQELMEGGVTLADPSRLDVRGNVSAGEDCFIDVNVVLQGRVVMGDSVTIGPGCVISDSELGSGVYVHPNTVVEGAVVAADCNLGPFARIRPGTQLGEGVKIGNFVETKQARLGAGTKASHLAYLGDAELGEDCNVGAGTVTCNYDGVSKHRTSIGDRVFVGTNSTLVAPIGIGDDAYVGAGSTLTSKVGDGDLAIGRARQRNIHGWVRPDRREAKDD
tara:strand:+ start:22799 stop:24190 length:1392 start_codon:yes stop_codon:yes gene_type:complete